jgi:hypothetical protein
MCRNYNELEFKHFIFVTTDGTIFACARENGHIYNFLIYRGIVRAQHREQWVDLDPAIAEIVRQRAEAAYARTPTYRTNRLLIN